MSPLIEVILFFAICVPIFLIGFELYARMLVYAGSKSSVAKHFIAALSYLLVAAGIISPLLIGFNLFEGWGEEYNSNDSFMVVLLVCYVLSIVPSVYRFNKRHKKNLQQYGFFK